MDIQVAVAQDIITNQEITGGGLLSSSLLSSSSSVVITGIIEIVINDLSKKKSLSGFF